MKKEIRKKMLEMRKNLSKFEVTNSSEIIVNKIKNSKDFKEAKIIGIYYPIRNEIDLLKLFEENKTLCLPRVFGDEMEFFIVNSIEDLHLGCFNVYEPNDNLKRVDKNKMDIIYVPCVGLSNDFYRIGYGKGYYDRYLLGYLNKKIAVCYKFQVINEKFYEEFDVKLDSVITD